MSDLAGDRDRDRVAPGAVEAYYLASQWQLMWRKFRRHHLAIVGGVILGVLYVVAIFCDFFTPYPPEQLIGDAGHHPPSRIRLLGLFTTRVRLFGVEPPGAVFLFGADRLSRDLFSRTICAARISLTIGLLGVASSFIIGVVLGGLSGFYGGRVDMFIQRVIEFLTSIPTIPLWMALAAALPREWRVIQIYFAIVLILSLVSGAAWRGSCAASCWSCASTTSPWRHASLG